MTDEAKRKPPRKQYALLEVSEDGERLLSHHATVDHANAAGSRRAIDLYCGGDWKEQDFGWFADWFSVAPDHPGGTTGVLLEARRHHPRRGPVLRWVPIMRIRRTW